VSTGVHGNPVPTHQGIRQVAFHGHLPTKPNNQRSVGPLIITNLQLKNAQPLLRPNGTYKDVWFRDGGGLYLRITGTPSGQITKYWLYRYCVKGKDRRLGLGPYPTVSLADARRLAELARRQRKEQCIDPIAERRRQDQAREIAEQKAVAEQAVAKARTVTFAQAAEEYHAAHKPQWRSTKHATKWKALIAEGSIETDRKCVAALLP
jgi:hypothetical protein